MTLSHPDSGDGGLDRTITAITLVDNSWLHGVNGWVANSSDQRLYREEDRDE
jgi:hypothetical protein